MIADRRPALGARLRQKRADRGLSLSELARRVAVSPSLVSQIEAGRVNPSVKTLCAMARELGASLDDIVGPTSSMAIRPAAPNGIHGEPEGSPVQRGFA